MAFGAIVIALVVIIATLVYMVHVQVKQSEAAKKPKSKRKK
jgi:hypothetical protein